MQRVGGPLLITTLAFLIGALGLTGCTLAAKSGGRHTWTEPGVLRFTEGQEVDTLNPILTTQIVVTDLSTLTQGYLLLYDRRDELVPSLALRVPTQSKGLISRDGLTITYELRRGVVWQDGAPFTSADVAFSVKTILDPKVNASSTEAYDNIASVATPDPYTVVLHLKHPDSSLVSRFLTPGIGSGILPKHLLDGQAINGNPFNSKPVGLGPFQYVRWTRGSEIDMVAFDRWWGGRPKLRRIVYRIVPDANTALSQLQTHELDAFGRFPNTQYAQAKAIPNTRTLDVDSTAYEHVDFNLQNPDLADPRVRRALAHAIDIPAIIAKINHGQGVAACTPIPTFSWAYDALARCYPYDLTVAARLLDAAGWRIGTDGMRRRGGWALELTLVSTAGNVTRDQTAALIATSFRQLGVQLEYRRFQANQLFAHRVGILQMGKFDLALYAWYWNPDPDLSVLYACDQWAPHGQNVVRYCNRDFDRLLADAKNQYGRTRRRSDYVKAQQLLSDDVPSVTLSQQRVHLTADDDFRRLDPGPILLFSNPALISN
jgi:peptide/nickel transport system substrate-binding protein